MDDGPKLLPQWLRGSSSLHHRGDASDSSKRLAGKPAGSDVSSRSGAPPSSDPWPGGRSSSGLGANGLTSSASLGTPRSAATSDFSRPSPAGPGVVPDRSWRPREGASVGGYGGGSSAGGYGGGVSAGGYGGGGGGPRPGPGYVPLKPGGARDDGISLKPGGGSSYGVSLRPYSRPGESDGGGRPGQDWPLARAQSGGGGPGLGPRAEEDSRPPPRDHSSSGGPLTSTLSSKASFDKDFPSLRPTPGPGPGPGAGPGPGGSPISAAPPPGSISSPLLDPASGSTSASANAVPPYRQTFLSARTTSNWTSKLAEAPPCSGPPPAGAGPGAPQASPSRSAFQGGDDEGLVAPMPSYPSPSPSPPPAAPAAPLAPSPAVAPRPAGVWGSAAATVMAAPPADAQSNGAPASSTSRARMEQLALKQSKQLIPLVSSAAAKAKAGGGGMGAGASAGPGLGLALGGAVRLGGGVPAAPKPASGAAAGPALRAAAKREDAAAGGTLGSAVILSKKTSQPLDRPPAASTLGRAASAVIAPRAAGAGPGPEPFPPASLSSGNLVSAPLGSASAGAGADSGRISDSGAVAAPPAAPGPPSEQPCAPAPPPPVASGGPDAGLDGPRGSGPTHPALLVSAEEEAFLRSLGWTGFDEDEEDEDEAGLTEEEIEAFRRKQLQQQRSASAAGAGMGMGMLSSGGAAGPGLGLGLGLGSAGGASPLAAAAGGGLSVSCGGAAVPQPVPAVAACRRAKPLIVAASYGSEALDSSDSDSEGEE
ncbi:hypothetical protein HYH03_016484 [Edaphochlamys debaryana]|uniref:Uncharacterized protein n=1 Tax=Edaphochlamys debaryana TaxID=47281 RepID=A0A836BQ85_9CHLO|nr:hypothetical protein HYH03_016484 [Edaphochlamys debaryana]|eukprot:KAG2484737.1 hypothetical protein HYH03_016484 [Edaphochlamys debaryana]